MRRSRSSLTQLLLLFLLCFVYADLNAQTAKQRREIEKLRRELRIPVSWRPGSLPLQNAIARRDNLSYIKADSMQWFIDKGLLVRVPSSGIGYFINTNLLLSYRRYARLWVYYFIIDFGKSHAQECNGRRFKVSSMTRSVEYQLYLERTGQSDAQGTNPSRRSLHPTGSVFDISKKDMSRCSLLFLRERLLLIEREGAVDFMEEKNAFHIMVFRDEYMTRSGRVGKLVRPIRKYKVKAGDTLSEIAEKYKTTVERLKTLNNLHGDRILIGQTLRVP